MEPAPAAQPPPPPAPAPVPQSGTNIAWTMYFKNTSRCDWASCANIDGSGRISWAPSYGLGTRSYGPIFPIGVSEVDIGEYLTCKWYGIGAGHQDVLHLVKARPTVNPSTGAYLDWVLQAGAGGNGCDYSGSGGF